MGADGQGQVLIESDRPSTWPGELASFVDDVRDELRHWRQTARKIDDRARTDVMLRIHPPPNPRDAFAEECEREIARLLRGSAFLVRHCTRLCLDERDAIQSSGMEPLTRSLLHRRIDARVAAGDLNSLQAERFRQQNCAEDDNRSGRTWWIAGKSAIRDESAVVRLLRSWGGEALYVKHESDSTAAPLRSLGEATIVEAEIPVEDLDAILAIERRVRDAIAADEFLEFEATTIAVIPGSAIRSLVVHGAEEFENLTGASTWASNL